YYNGLGVQQDYAEAVKWFRKAAEQGHAGAQYRLGICYGKGLGVPQDHEEAAKWVRKAAEQGDAGAIELLKKWGEY
ncbi:MAG: sel1 repeat family protein, partial [Kiritimatiellae bacterium]|nr:sel1 repeat family protein [Kiritimatiellia bacterium]